MQEEKKSGKEEDKAPTKKMKIKLDPMDGTADNKMDVCAFLFENVDAKSWIKWRIQLHELTCNMPLTTRAKKIKVAKALLKGQAREYFIDMRTDFELNNNNKNDKEEYFVEAIEGHGSISSVLLPKELPQVLILYGGYTLKGVQGKAIFSGPRQPQVSGKFAQ